MSKKEKSIGVLWLSVHWDAHYFVRDICDKSDLVYVYVFCNGWMSILGYEVFI
jgi:hypothetical protein